MLQAKNAAWIPSVLVNKLQVVTLDTADFFEEAKGLEILSRPASPLRNEHIGDRLESS